MAELMAIQKKAKYGSVREISAIDYVDEVNKAGDGVWVVLHLYKSGIPLCSLINQHLYQLAVKYPTTKFLNSISTTCIPNYPVKNLPTIFVYFEGDLKGQLVGPFEFGGMSVTLEGIVELLMNVKACSQQYDSGAVLCNIVSPTVICERPVFTQRDRTTLKQP